MREAAVNIVAAGAGVLGKAQGLADVVGAICLGDVVNVQQVLPQLQTGSLLSCCLLPCGGRG